LSIKSILREELKNSKHALKNFELALQDLPRGSLVKRRIHGREYWYLIYRDQGKFKADYRHSISVLKKQIKFLKGALRGKEEI